MSFPAGWTQEAPQQWSRKVEPTAAALAYALMTLPAATIITYAETPYISGEEERVTRIWYDVEKQQASLS